MLAVQKQLKYLSLIIRKNAFFVLMTTMLLVSGDLLAQKKNTKSTKKTTTQKSSTSKSQQKSTTQKKSTAKTPASQVPKTEAGRSTEEDEKKVRDIVAFFQYVLNTLGSSETPARDKDVLITQSYSKIFRDEKVQVEDDLDEERLVITNKDIIAYLKDVDFFFNDAKFEFTIDAIKKGTTPDGKDFYKVSTTRNLSGTTSDGNSVNKNIIRFFEINYDPASQDLKIESIYTNQLDPKGALVTWWNELSYEWKNIFTKKLNFKDSVRYTDIKKITEIVDLDLNSNRFIQNIEPLAQLTGLKLLDLSATNITDLKPIRNLTELIELNLSNTKINDITPLRYASKIQRLNLDYTQVNNISVLEKMTVLQNLQVNRAPIMDFSPIKDISSLTSLNVEGTKLRNLSDFDSLTQLIDLNIAKTFIEDIGIVKKFPKLSSLNIDSTLVHDLSPLAGLLNLKLLHANYTLVNDLKPLLRLPRLEKIYCDQTGIKREAADAFMAANKNVLVVFDSKDLRMWWESLSIDWQNVFTAVGKISAQPGKDELARLTNLDSINVAGKTRIKDVEPLRKLPNLKTLVANRTSITDLSGLAELTKIQKLDISDCAVSDISVVKGFKNLRELIADRTKVEKLDPLFGLPSLKKVLIDQSTVHDIIALEFLEQNPRCLIVYKTNHLNRWWHSLSQEWKDVFQSQMEHDTTTTRENLHRLAERSSLTFKDAAVNDLTVLSEFIRLRELHFSGTGISAIPVLENLKTITSLHATSSPLQQINTLAQFTALEDLNISDTPVDELKPLASLQNLKKLNCSGTQIKKLDALRSLSNLESLDCSNTKVSSLDEVEGLPLKSLKCYNTKISEREIKNFKEKKPDCAVVYYR